MTNALSNILAFIFALGIIVFVHEFGHLILAKGFRVRVHTFSLGFGKRLWGFRRGETDYRVSLVPLGGYVKLGGETPEEATGDEREFMSRPRWQRILVYVAGPAMNVILSIVLIALVFMAGFGMPMLSDLPPVVGIVLEGSPGDRAGLVSGDEIVSLNGNAVDQWQDVSNLIMDSPEQEIDVVYLRGGATASTVLVPDKDEKYEIGEAGLYARVVPRVTDVFADSPAAAAGFAVGDRLRAVDGRPLGSSREFVDYVEGRSGTAIEIKVLRGEESLLLEVVPRGEDGQGRIGIGLTDLQRLPPLEAVVQSARFNVDFVVRTFDLLGQIFTGQRQPQTVLSGPIEIAIISGEAARRGVADLVLLIGMVSISIAVLNLLPIPILDGGHIFILFVESILRRDLSVRLKESFNFVGLVLIVLLMVMVLVFDVRRNLPSGEEPKGSQAPASQAQPADP